ncbi:uncharacterized protein LOC133205188 isoform X2 [Saccostrea echinata]|nr:uncharacterized protein LOC133205188 isoform X2 [Saccostrea echinata]
MLRTKRVSKSPYARPGRAQAAAKKAKISNTTTRRIQVTPAPTVPVVSTQHDIQENHTPASTAPAPSTQTPVLTAPAPSAQTSALTAPALSTQTPEMTAPATSIMAASDPSVFSAVAKVQEAGPPHRLLSLPSSSGILEPFEQEVEQLLRASVSHNTQEIYQKGLDSFSQFRKLFNLKELWPPPIDQLINYIAYLSSKGTTYTTAKTYLAGLSFTIKLGNFPDPCQFFIVKKMLHGFKQLKHRKDSRSPITFPLLVKIIDSLQHVCRNYYEKLLFSSAYGLAFFALLRVGEITSTKANPPSSPLSIQNVSISQSSILITLGKTKTDQHGKGTTMQINSTKQNQVLFHNIQAYMTHRPSQTQTSQFLCHMDGSPMTYYQFNQVLKKVLSFLKLDTSTFKSHSFRIGAATSLYMQGTPEQEIKTMGRWKSNAFKSYVRPNAVVL